MDDRLLSHVEAVVGAKLRRGEAFMLTIGVEPVEGSGRVSIWVNRASSLVLKYRHARPRLNTEWLELLMTSANSPTGMRLLPEPSSAQADETA
ncbi:hypothetical protein ACIGEP_15930 [Microbacterium sp. NPDC077663]|uniref:DUF7882 family protein n=1 Tax=Microbacterium sp. NPDC077663 TaxID=3364189 RepID=UPI0037C9F050